MTNYEQLREKLNELLPDLKEHGEQCFKWEIESEDENGKKFEGFCPDCLMTEVEASKEDCQRKITIADVLRGLNNIWESEKYVFSSNGWFGHIDEVDHGNPIAIDLSKPLSAPENDEACGAILKLLSE